MFELGEPLDPPRLRAWTSALAESDLPTEPADLVDEIRALEELACAARARQSRLSAALDAASEDTRAVAQQVALARRESPHRGRQHLSLARIADELPHAMAAFRRGLVSEWRVSVLARETACLTREDRLAVDRSIAGDPEAFSDYSDRVVLAETRKLVARLDPGSVAERRRRAESERCVTLRPAPDTMVYLTALLPVAQGVAAYAALAAEADRGRATGAPRARGQAMADALVARVTGAATDADGVPAVPVSIDLVMTDRALLAGAHDDAAITGHGPVPADLARDLVLRSLDARSRTWVRRLYRHPETHELVAMDSRQRLFPRSLATFLRFRDQWCRPPWCGPPRRPSAHDTPGAPAGATTPHAPQGLCEACNYAKEAPGWQHHPRPGPDGHTVEITTPTGHTYRSPAPPVLGLRHPAYQEVQPGVWSLVA